MRVRFVLVGLLALLVLGLSPEGAEASTTSTASLSNAEVQPDGGSFIGNASITDGGLQVAFYTAADKDISGADLAGADGTVDIFVRTDANGNGVFSDAGDSTVLISRQDDEAAAANGDSFIPAIAPLGRFVVFASAATNLPQNGLDTNGFQDIFIRDRDPDGDGTYDEAADPGSTGRVSVTYNELQANGASNGPDISRDGVLVAFASSASNLISGTDNNGVQDIFIRDRGAQTTVRPSVDSCEGQADGASVLPSIEYSGEYISFQSDATDLDLDANNDGVCEGSYDTNGVTDIFLRDRTTAQLSYRVSVPDDASLGTEGNGRSFDRAPVSLGARFVVFRSSASNLVSGDTNGVDDVFVRDLDEDNDGILNESGATSTVRMSVATDESEGNAWSYSPTISYDGRYVAFTSSATNLVSGDTNGVDDVFVHDRDPDDDGIFDEANAYTVRASLSSSEAQGNGASNVPALDALSLRSVAFNSAATNLAGGDSNGQWDVFARSLDGDNDTILEPFDNCPTLANPGQENAVHPGTALGDHCEDPEPDGVYDLTDNCPDTANAGQANAVHPGTALGDHCEDPEPDGVYDATDNCPDTANAGQQNAVHPGTSAGDHCEDPEPDGVFDATDSCPDTANPGQENAVHPGTSAGDHCEDPEPDGVFDATDNCPDTVNPGQQNAVHPGTFAGDHCEDPEPDGVFDLTDNCPDTSNPGQENADGDQWGDACELCPTYATAWMVQPGDGDCDAFTDTDEGTIGTDAADPCPDNAADDAWPSDFDKNKVINISDVVNVLPPYFGTTVPPTSARRDLAPDGVINISDVVKVLPPYFGSSCQ